MQRFQISMAQASVDLQRFLKLHPGAMVYHTRKKRYERAQTTTSAPVHDSN
jgi:hypothetical protein